MKSIVFNIQCSTINQVINFYLVDGWFRCMDKARMSEICKIALNSDKLSDENKEKCKQFLKTK